MKTEIEAKFLDVDVLELKKLLVSLGAQLSQSERLMKRKIFDYPDGRLDKTGGWVRVRDEGDKTTLSYKQQSDESLHGTKEVTVVVDDFEGTCELFESIGLVDKSYQETRRESWILGDTEIEIDTWPWVPTFVEVESPSEESMRRILDKLGLELENALHGGVATVYKAYYDVTDDQINNLQNLTFDEKPEILRDKAQ